jgi:predicted kinase
MRPTFVILSGLPGTGKTTLAERLAGDLGWLLIAVDDLALSPAPLDSSDPHSFWNPVIQTLLEVCETQLHSGTSVIADSAFMDRDRFHAKSIARNTGARFRPVHTFVSDEGVWEQRVRERFEVSDPDDDIATWERIQRREFRPWEPGTALFVDTARPPENGYQDLLRFVTSSDYQTRPLPDVPFTPGDYHQRDW